MRLIVAVIQPHRLDPVRDALAKVGVQGLTVTEVRGFGRQKGHREIYRGAEYQIAYVPKIKLEVAVPADLAERVVETIRDSARTGNIGDGKIFVLALESAVRVRTGETGDSAL
jgi:nitrogen regulatory protein P-II 2